MSGISLLKGDAMIEALKINLRNKKDTELMIGKILSQLNRDTKTEKVEIQEEFLKYNSNTRVLRIFVE